jgi:Kdo2-lipid IVA lauroyltransferase/acyltransferase
MKIIFYISAIYPLKFVFLLWDFAFKALPISILRFSPQFKVTKKNLSIAFPGLNNYELNSLAKESYKETLKSFYETLYTWSRSKKKIIYQTKKINNRFLFNTPGQKNGLIIFALHNRSIDFMLRWISSQRSHTSLYKKIKFKPINRFVKKIREEGNSKMVETGIGGVKTILNSLEKNQMTCMASDQVPADGLGVYSKFFGHECYSFALAPKLARKSNKQILMSYLSYEKDIGHIINFKKPSNDIYKNNGVDVMNREMENVIKKSPTEYSWEYKKFRKLSQEPKDIYKT